jgi:hypothetical protein
LQTTCPPLHACLSPLSPSYIHPSLLQYVATYYRTEPGYKNHSAKAVLEAWDEGKRYPDMGDPKDSQADNMCKVSRPRRLGHAMHAAACVHFTQLQQLLLSIMWRQRRRQHAAVGAAAAEAGREPMGCQHALAARLAQTVLDTGQQLRHARMLVFMQLAMHASTATLT